MNCRVRAVVRLIAPWITAHCSQQIIPSALLSPADVKARVEI